MTTETNEARLARLKHVAKIFSEPRISAEDTLFLLGRAERAREWGVENSRLKDDWKGTQEVLRKSIEISDDYEAENTRLQELVKILKVHAVHCDADERAIQPYEIIDVINEFTAGDPDGQR